MKRNHFPDWLFIVLVLILGGVVAFYTLQFGSPSAIAKDHLKAEQFHKLLDEQPKIESIKNSSVDDLTIQKVCIVFLDSLKGIRDTILTLPESDLGVNVSISLSEFYSPSKWNGECYAALIHLSKIDESERREDEVLFFDFQKIINEKNVLKIY